MLHTHIPPYTTEQGDIAQCYADPALARETLDWQAQLGIDAMCADTWRWQQWAAQNL
jgi:UDP-glucose 4-epimerase